MTKQEVLKLICDSKRQIDKSITTDGLLKHWYWNVGFRDIEIDEDHKRIICIVSRPNQFISKYQRKIKNFLVYLSRKIFRPLGYSFELKKDMNDECYELFKNYINTKQ